MYQDIVFQNVSWNTWIPIISKLMAGEAYRSPEQHQRPLWQPWFSENNEGALRSPPTPLISEHEAANSEDHREFATKELPTKSRKDRRRKELEAVFSRTKHGPRREVQILKDHHIDDVTEAPLDMSTNRRNLHIDLLPKPPSYAQSIEYLRPSVITCTTIGRTSSPPGPSNPGEKSQRREIISGMCDPVIDEHFRRSLGDRYSHLFGSSTSNEEEPNSSGLTSPASGDAKSPTVSVTGFSVDDHFAKALGETWLKLQNDEGKEKDKSSSKPGSPLTAKQHHGLVII